MLALALAALVAPISHGAITVNRGIAGARLGMTRAQVVSHLGKPLSENRGGPG
jgi:outer membrane protein assembly factor BamE (lipoprotein component of BamABCDE complex)